VCGSCLFEGNKTYFKNAIFYCFECNDLYKYLIVLFVALILLIALLIFLIWSKQNQDPTEDALIKIMINHVQFVSFISNIKITLPDVLQNFSSVQAPVTSADTFVFALDCFRDKFDYPLFAVKIFLSLGIILFILFVIFFIFLLIKMIKKKTWEDTLVSILNSLVIVATFLQPQFINFYIQMLSCDTYDDLYMAHYLEQRCWTGDHLVFSLALTIPLLAFWMIIYPFIFLHYMYKNKNQLENPKVKKITMFFRAGFKKNMYYWDFVIMSRKFSIILLTAFLRDEIESVIYVLIPIIAIFCALQIYLRPYGTKKFNQLEITSLNASFVTYYSAIFYLRIISDELKFFFLVLILGVNVVFVLMWLKEYLLTFKKAVSQVGKIFSKIASNTRNNRKTIVPDKVEIGSFGSAKKLKD
jgi:hypothetical protein